MDSVRQRVCFTLEQEHLSRPVPPCCISLAGFDVSMCLYSFSHIPFFPRLPVHAPRPWYAFRLFDCLACYSVVGLSSLVLLISQPIFLFSYRSSCALHLCLCSGTFQYYSFLLLNCFPSLRVLCSSRPVPVLLPALPVSVRAQRVIMHRRRSRTNWAVNFPECSRLCEKMFGRPTSPFCLLRQEK